MLQDLCARLPYGVKCCVCNNEQNQKYYGRKKFDITLNIDNICDFLGQDSTSEYIDIKPYLRPISSMTKEEQEEFVKFHCVNLCPIIITDDLTIENEAKMIDWLNGHQFDYHKTSEGKSMIEAGLALEAPEGMYN